MDGLIWLIMKHPMKMDDSGVPVQNLHGARK